MKTPENNCGGQGCNTPEHDKRLGHDNVSIHVNFVTGHIGISNTIDMGTLTRFIKNNFREDWEKVTISFTPEYSFSYS